MNLFIFSIYCLYAFIIQECNKTLGPNVTKEDLPFLLSLD